MHLHIGSKCQCLFGFRSVELAVSGLRWGSFVLVMKVELWIVKIDMTVS